MKCKYIEYTIRGERSILQVEGSPAADSDFCEVCPNRLKNLTGADPCRIVSRSKGPEVQGIVLVCVCEHYVNILTLHKLKESKESIKGHYESNFLGKFDDQDR